MTFASGTLAAFYLRGDNDGLLGFPSFMLMNIMASRLYRQTKLGRLDSDAMTSSLSAPHSRLVFTSPASASASVDMRATIGSRIVCD